MPKKLKTLLSIAGSDPTGGAGIQADIRAGISLGLHVMTVVTAVTAQNSLDFIDLGVVESHLVNAQLSAIKSEVIPDAIKIGMVGSEENLKIIAEYLLTLPREIPIVVDPVLKSSIGGKNLSIDEEIITLYQQLIFPLATVITPNLTEMEFVPKKFPQIIKGGHVKSSEFVIDCLLYGDKILSNKLPKVNCKNLHGTGCIYSSLLASYLALGKTLEDAFYSTSENIHQIITRSCEYSMGESHYGPLNINNYFI